MIQSVGGTESAVTRVFRMGRSIEGRPRPLKIILSDSDTKMKLLRGQRQLVTQMQLRGRFFLRHDLTQQQRDEQKQLRDLRNQLASHQVNTGRQLVIRGNRIVDKADPQFSATLPLSLTQQQNQPRTFAEAVSTGNQRQEVPLN